MNFEELRRYQVNEREGTGLQKLPEPFYQDLTSYIEEGVKEDAEIKGMNYLDLMRSVSICANEIKERRFNKIVNYAITETRSNKDEFVMPECLVGHETSFYEACCDLFNTYLHL